MSNFRKSNGNTERVKLKTAKVAQTKTSQPAPKEQTKVNKNNKNLLAFNKSLDDKGKLIIDYLKVCSNCKNKFVTENRYANTCCDECQTDNKIRNGERFVFYTPNKNITSNFNIYEYPRRNQKTPLMPKQPDLESIRKFTVELYENVYDLNVLVTIADNGFCNVEIEPRKLYEIYKQQYERDYQFFCFESEYFELLVNLDYSYETRPALSYPELRNWKNCVKNGQRFFSNQELKRIDEERRQEELDDEEAYFKAFDKINEEYYGKIFKD
ncbi:MAG: hypothetical protein MUF43_14875 [Flavobacterium sp.]|jgi:hypothetical protein|nr:hypothetical protein [Flavobacterium sp.]